ncbi:uncharacterized protein LOC143374319 [Andrena cerasifolii]|uniref:uncharacterized protein LOC143374319 n=1 Tax=Andrena cerasifolii TaxID=2819439 RepID=UPI004037DE2B
MEACIPPPQPLSEAGDMSENWQRWKKDFLLYLEASNNSMKSDDLKAYLLRSQIGKVGQDAIDKIIPQNSKDKDDINILLAKLDSHFSRKNKQVVDRYNFFTRSKKHKESIEEYIEDLKKMAASCSFGHITNSLIRDRVIADLKDKNLRQKLFEIQNLDLFALTTAFKEHETLMQQKTQAFKKNTAQVKKPTSHCAHISNIENANNNCNITKVPEQSQQNLKNKETRRCWRCRQQHPSYSCPAWGFKCEKCGERNHYTFCCQTGNDNQRRGINVPKINTSIPPHNLNLQRGNQQYNNVPNVPIVPNVPSAPCAPSAPQHFGSNNNALYPNLHYPTTVPENKPNPNAWSWVEQQNVKVNNDFQRTAPQAMNASPSRNPPTPAAGKQKKDSKDSCTVS